MLTKFSGKSQWIRIAISVISVILIGILIYREWDQITLSLISISPGFFLLLFGLTLVSRVMVSLRWYFLLQGATIKIDVLTAIKITFMGLFASNFLPTTIGGDIIRLAAATRISKKPIPITASLIMDRVVGIVGMLMLSPLGLLQIISAGGLNINNPKQVEALLFGSSIKQLFAKLKKRIDSLVGESRQVFSSWFKSPISLIFSILSTFSHMAILFITIKLLLERLNNPINFWVVGGLWSISYLITLIPISINGLGLQELSLSLLFSQIGQIDYSAAAMMAVLIRVLQMLASIPGGIVMYFIFPGLINEIKEQK